MSAQPKALALADALLPPALPEWVMTLPPPWHPRSETCSAAAAELRRLHAVNAELLSALQAIVDLDDGDSPDLWHFEAEFEAARAAIARAQGSDT